MMLDRTTEFLKVIKQKQTEDGLPKRSILTNKPRKPRTEFGVNSVELVSNITKLRDFLLSNRKAYVGGFGQNDKMSDRARDSVDAESQKIIKLCSQSLAQLKEELKGLSSLSQLQAHRKYTVDLIDVYLKTVCQIYSEQRAIRVKQVVEKKRASRLQTDTSKYPSDPTRAPTQNSFIPKPSKFLGDDSEDELSPEDAAILEQENVQLLNDMNSVADEVKAIEGKVVEIAKLQEMFSEQVLQQEKDIDIVSEKVVEISENVKDGNEELREAIKNNAGFRVWILFFLVMCSFSLLFLEWYS